jgi:hypothetical protein
VHPFFYGYLFILDKLKLIHVFIKGHKSTCPVKNIECLFCHTTRIQSEHTLHLEECPEKPVACYHAEFGCSWKGHQRDLSDHIDSCSYEPLKGFFNMYKQRNEALEQENQRLKTTIQELNSTVSLLENQVSAMSDWLSNFTDSKGILSNSEGQPSSSSDHELLLSSDDHMKNEIENLSLNLMDLDAIMTENMRMQEEIQSVKNICYGLRMQMHYLLMERRGGEPSVGTSGPTNSVVRTGLNGHIGIGRTVPPNANNSPDSSSELNTRPLRSLGPGKYFLSSLENNHLNHQFIFYIFFRISASRKTLNNYNYYLIKNGS